MELLSASLFSNTERQNTQRQAFDYLNDEKVAAFYTKQGLVK